MKNISDMKLFLLNQMQELNDGRLSAGDALASAALASRVICCEKLQMEASMIGGGYNIPMNNVSMGHNDIEMIDIDQENRIFGERLDRVRL